MDKKQREERRRQEDLALQRGLLWVAGAIVLEALLVLVNRYYINYRIEEAGLSVSIGWALRGLRAVAAVAAVAAVVYAVLRLRQGKGCGVPLTVSLACAAVAICSHVAVKFQGPGVSMLFWLVVAWAVLALIFYIYQREFFLSASACGMAALGAWLMRYGSSGRLEAVLLLVATALAAAAALWMKKSDGVLTFGKTSIQFLPKQTGYTVSLATCGVSLAALAVALFLGGTAAYYLVFVMVAWLFALFVYYTVKLM